MKTREPGILVLGLGNVLLRDEGVGVRALECLVERYALPKEVQALDGGTMGLDLLPYVERASALLILDAVQTGQPPGSLVRLEGDEIPATLALKLSVHQVGFQELLAASLFRGTMPARIVLLGIEPALVEWGLDLSPSVAAALDELVECAMQELRDWGVSIRSLCIPVAGARS
jgi:hydrogenase maturation protease